MMRSKSDIVFVLVLLVISLGVNVWQAKTPRGLSSADVQIPRQVLIRHTAFKIPIQSLSFTGIDGSPAVLSFPSDKPLLLYVMRRSCKWCSDNTSAVKALYESTRDRVRFIGVSLDSEGISEYKNEFSLPFDVVSTPSAQTSDSLGGLGVTPQTILVSPSGQLTDIWDGTFSGSVKVGLESRFGVTLPESPKESIVSDTPG